MSNQQRKHKPNCQCQVCKDGMAAYRRKEAELLARNGYLYHFIPNDPAMPTGVNLHTHGLDVTFNHPDLQLVLDLDQELAVTVLGAAVLRVKAGERFKAGDRVEGILRGCSVLFVKARESGRPVLRMIIPDSQGNLEPGTIAEGYECQYADLIDSTDQK